MSSTLVFYNDFDKDMFFLCGTIAQNFKKQNDSIQKVYESKYKDIARREFLLTATQEVCNRLKEEYKSKVLNLARFLEILTRTKEHLRQLVPPEIRI